MLWRMALIGALLLAPIVLSLLSQRLAQTVGPPVLPQDVVNVPLSGAGATPQGRAGRARSAPVPAPSRGARLPSPAFEMPAAGEQS